MPSKFFRNRFQPCLPMGEDGRRITACDEHIALSGRAASEGMVLLKNNGVLPLAKGTKIALFGMGGYDYIHVGGGSGFVYTRYVRNIIDGFRLKAENGQVSLFEPLNDFYKDAYKKETRFEEPAIPDEIFRGAEAFADVAVITIHRYSVEGQDRKPVKGDFYLSDGEEALVARVCAAFERVAVVLDIGAPIACRWFADNGRIGAALVSWQAGMEGGLAVADILCGNVNPSGKLADTFADCYEDYPAARGFQDYQDHVDYTEDIYVGYRYFETLPGADQAVVYPFGFGLSYTTFAIENVCAACEDDRITVTASVTNTGDMAGREVVQVYFEAPQGLLGKPKRQLCAFQKTESLPPGGVQVVTMTFAVGDMASYDDLGKRQKSAFVLEQGDYRFFVGNSVRRVTETDFHYTVSEEYRVVSQHTSLVAPHLLKERLLADGSYEPLPMPEQVYQPPVHEPIGGKAPDNVVELEHVGDTVTPEDFIAQMSDAELADFLSGGGKMGLSQTGIYCTRNERLGIFGITTDDGPAGIAADPRSGVRPTAWPCATLIADTWDPDIAREIGAAAAKEAEENNICVWLTPALNIHRNPLCGRNFEYYSEDPFISGKMACAMTEGVQSQGIAVSAKHFVANNRERARTECDSRMSERALREIYLKGFEMCVKQSKPLTIMASYNLVNGCHSSENYELLDGILRKEWGFEGIVTTDWGSDSDHVREVRAGTDVKMISGEPHKLLEALQSGELTRADMEVCALRIVRLYQKFF